jgi:hypothetical protein
MPLLSNPCLRWVTALNLAFFLCATGCKEGSNTKVESASTIEKDTAGEVPVPRVAAGSMAPDFALPSSTGGIVTLSTLLRESAVALVFYRSAVW